MNIPDSIPEGIKEDKTVQFIAQRHHITVDGLLESYIRYQQNADRGKETLQGPSICLEDNEVLIIRDLIGMYHQ